MRRTRKNSCRRVSNYYNTINKEWVDDLTLPETEARTTQAYFIQEKIDAEIAAIIDTEAKKPGPIHDFVKSWDLVKPIPDGLSPMFQIMLSMSNTSDIASRIGWMNRYGIPSPLSIYVQGDPRIHRTCRVFIEEGNPNIGIPEYWLIPEYSGNRAAYKRYVTSLARTLGLPQILQGLEAEHEFSKVYPNAVEEQKVHINMSTWSELTWDYRHIDWRILLTALGLEEKQLHLLQYNVTSPAFLHHLQNRIVRWNMDRWCGWFCMLVAQWAAKRSPHGPLRNPWYEYSHHFLQGRLADISPQELRYKMVRHNMPNTIGKLWVQKHCDPKMRRTVTAMAERIRGAAATMLAKTSWMSASTRAAAVRKVRNIDIQICWPDFAKWTAQEAPCSLADRWVDNLLALAKLSTDENQKQLRLRDCRHPAGEAWSRPVFDVNAYYYPDENRFLLPAAILRPPFYDARKSLVWNYGAIGATIGHELCHAFDSEGRKYDEHGDRRDWWTEHDDREYRRKARQVQRLYETRPYRDMDVNGELTLTENIADMGGLDFAMAGIRLALGRALTRNELREFFESFAISWRSKERMKQAAHLLDVDPHAPPKLRVNHVVRQMDEWYLAYDISPECPDYIKPEHRIHFFS
jgi:endothelin-converting enzyme/putative endopeptidase